jgi:hypothetical protein
MTGCDLRYLAEEMVRRSTDERNERRNTIGILADDLASALAGTPVAGLVTAVTEIVNQLRNQVDDDRAQTYETQANGFDVIEKIRAHFHEAVDQRVEEEVENREEDHSDCTSQEAVSEAVSEARSELLDEVRDAITRALDRL